MARLWVTYDNETQLSAPVNSIFIDCGRQEHNITVFVDGSDTINHFTMTVSDGWITANRIRNSVSVIVKENAGLFDRVGKLTFRHNMDADKVVEIVLVQSPHDYTIAVQQNGEDVDEITFTTLMNRDDQDSEEQTVDVVCGGGLEDYRIGKVYEYAKKTPSDNYRLVPYDNGLKLKKIGNGTLSITNFGKLSSLYDVYYNVTLSHRNNYRSVCTLKVSYASDDIGSGFELAD